MAKVLEGTRVRLISMADEAGMVEGLEGTISSVDSAGTVHVAWDNGRTLGLIAGVDKWEVIK